MLLAPHGAGAYTCGMRSLQRERLEAIALRDFPLPELSVEDLTQPAPSVGSWYPVSTAGIGTTNAPGVPNSSLGLSTPRSAWLSLLLSGQYARPVDAH
jgi:hypothetical protein